VKPFRKRLRRKPGFKHVEEYASKKVTGFCLRGAFDSGFSVPLDCGTKRWTLTWISLIYQDLWHAAL
jgi:hypothetical protein